MKKAVDREGIRKEFRNLLLQEVQLLNSAVSTKEGDWKVKGFIDIAKNIYTISADTKVISKIMELILFPKICRLAEKNDYKIVLSKEQNYYPDISFSDRAGNLFAVDIKSTYRKTKKKVNGMTLGAFTGYFRDRSSTKNIEFSYENYTAHLVLGIIYSRSDEASDERKVYKIESLRNIPSVIRDFTFFVQEKYRIASTRPGSGNTKNIGSITNAEDLINGRGPFAELGESIFDDYWMYYLTNDMVRAVDLKKAPYRKLVEYKQYKKLSR